VAVRRRIWILPALLFALLAVGCGSDSSDDVAQTGDPIATTSTTSAPAGGGGEVEGPEWVLDLDDSTIDAPDGTSITLTVAEGQATGVAACNPYFGPFEVDGTTLTVGRLGSTQMACDPALLDADEAYLTALNASDTIEVTEDTLVLTGPEESRLSFTAVDRAQALVGQWQVTSLSTTDAVASVPEGDEPTLEFLDDGTLSASAGCNGGGGTWELDGAELTIGPIASTQMACDEPAGVMEREADLFAALEASKQVQVTADALTLLREDGTITLDAVPAEG
jgi:heat shock protein HslJ